MISKELYQKYVDDICKDLWFFNKRFDGDLDHLNSLHKRVNALANKDAVPDDNNKLWIVWSNMKAMLNKEDTNYYNEVIYFTAVMAKKIDDYSKNNLLDGNQTISKILYELDVLKPCVYEILELN